MKNVIRGLITLIVLYLLIGMFFAIKFYINYDPDKYSVPNGPVTFIINLIIWPF